MKWNYNLEDAPLNEAVLAWSEKLGPQTEVVRSGYGLNNETVIVATWVTCWTKITLPESRDE